MPPVALVDYFKKLRYEDILESSAVHKAHVKDEGSNRLKKIIIHYP